MRVGSKRLRFQRHGRRKFVIFILVVAAIIAAVLWLFLAGPLKPADSSTPAASSAGPQESATPAASEEAIPSPTVLPSTAAEALPSASTVGTANIGTGGAALIGNSNLEDLYTYGQVSDAEYYYKVGLTVDEAMTAAADGQTEPILTAIDGKNFDRIFLMFGFNELGWTNRQKFFDDYKTLIETIRQENPNARIYIMSILPIAESVSDQAQDGVTQEAIDQLNSEMRTFASENNCYYMDLGAALKGDDGYLPADAAADGVHLNQQASAIWAEILNNEIGGEMG